MIEMPLNRTTPNAAPNTTASESPADAPEGAFEEMLSRNLGRSLARRVDPHKHESEQDAASGGTSGGTQFYHGGPITPWAPTATPAPSTQAAGAVIADPATAPASQIMTPASQAVAARVGLLTATPGVPAGVAGAAVTEPAAGAAVAIMAAGSKAIPAGPPRISDPWQGAASRAATPEVAAFPVDAQGGAASPTSVIGKPSSESGVLDSPRLGTTAMTPAGRAAAPETPQDLMGQQTVAPTVAPPSMAAAPATTAAPVTTATTATTVPVITDTRSVDQPAEPAATAPETATNETAASSTSAVQTQPLARPVAAPSAQLVNRVLRMVEFQQTQPPPRMVVVDMPELAGLRLMVAVQADGKVHVAPIAGSAPQQVAEPFMQAVGEALSAEGFDLAADSQQRQRRESPAPNEPAPATRRTMRRRRATGLRL